MVAPLCARPRLCGAAKASAPLPTLDHFLRSCCCWVSARSSCSIACGLFVRHSRTKRKPCCCRGIRPTLYAVLLHRLHTVPPRMTLLQLQVHSAWHACVPTTIAKDLDCKLLSANAAEGGMLTCTFNKVSLTMFQEVCRCPPC
jgi:hypothetical protein